MTILQPRLPKFLLLVLAAVALVSTPVRGNLTNYAISCISHASVARLESDTKRQDEILEFTDPSRPETRFAAVRKIYEFLDGKKLEGVEVKTLDFKAKAQLWKLLSDRAHVLFPEWKSNGPVEIGPQKAIAYYGIRGNFIVFEPDGAVVVGKVSDPDAVEKYLKTEYDRTKHELLETYLAKPR